MMTTPETNETRWLPRLLVVLAGLLTANSVLGPLGLETIEYRYSDSLINQGIGLDAIALIGAVPIAIWAARLVTRRHPAGPVLAFIPGTFAAYMAPQYIVGPDYLELPGNNERFFVFHLALFVAGIATTVVAWRSINRSQLEPKTAKSDRRRSLVLFGVVAFIFGGLWLARIVDLLGGDPTTVDYQENPTAYLLISAGSRSSLRPSLPWPSSCNSTTTPTRQPAPPSVSSSLPSSSRSAQRRSTDRCSAKDKRFLTSLHRT